jgi:hypothetical protein
MRQCPDKARSPVWPLREDAKTELLISADILVDEQLFRRDGRTANRSE